MLESLLDDRHDPRQAGFGILSLAGTGASAADAGAVLRAVCDGVNIGNDIMRAGSTCREVDSIIYLDLSHIEIDEACADALCRALSCLGSLRHLILHRSQLVPELAKRIVLSLSGVRGPKMLETLDLSNNCIDAECCSVLAKLLEADHCKLQRLSIDGNLQVGCRGAQTVAQALRLNTSLRTLNMRSCRLGLHGATALLQLLCENTGLVHVQVEFNRFGVHIQQSIELLSWRNAVCHIEETFDGAHQMESRQGPLQASAFGFQHGSAGTTSRDSLHPPARELPSQYQIREYLRFWKYPMNTDITAHFDQHAFTGGRADLVPVEKRHDSVGRSVPANPVSAIASALSPTSSQSRPPIFVASLQDPRKSFQGPEELRPSEPKEGAAMKRQTAGREDGQCHALNQTCHEILSRIEANMKRCGAHHSSQSSSDGSGEISKRWGAS